MYSSQDQDSLLPRDSARGKVVVKATAGLYLFMDEAVL
jgi:hypothetical protein